MATVNAKTYKRVLSTVVKSSNKQAENLQAVLMFGFEVAEKSGRLTVLTDAVNACGSMRAKITKTVSAYIADNVTGIKWDKKTSQYKKASKKTAIEVTIPEKAFWDHEANRENGRVVTFNLNNRLQSFADQVKKAHDEGKLKADKASLQAQLKVLENVIEKMTADISENGSESGTNVASMVL